MSKSLTKRRQEAHFRKTVKRRRYLENLRKHSGKQEHSQYSLNGKPEAVVAKVSWWKRIINWIKGLV